MAQLERATLNRRTALGRALPETAPTHLKRSVKRKKLLESYDRAVVARELAKQRGDNKAFLKEAQRALDIADEMSALMI